MMSLVPAMADLARRLARPSASDAGARYHRSAELAVHAAWHANWLALHGSDPARWRAWLSDWADWAPTVRPPVSEGEATITTTTTAPRWVAGVLAHRDAAAAGRVIGLHAFAADLDAEENATAASEADRRRA